MLVPAHIPPPPAAGAWPPVPPPPIRAMVLATAAFHVKLYVPFAIPALRLFRPRFVKSYVKAKMLTHDREQAARYKSDPLIFRQIAVNVLLDLHDTAKRLVADAGAIQTPTLMIGAGKDWVVSLEAQQKFFENLSSPEKQFHVSPSAYHAIFHEINRSVVNYRVRDFVSEQFAKRATTVSLQGADKSGFTFSEYERLKKNGSTKFA